MQLPDCRRDPTFPNAAKDCTLADWLSWYCNYDISTLAMPVAGNIKNEFGTYRCTGTWIERLMVMAICTVRLPKYPWKHLAANQSMGFRSNLNFSICPACKILWAPIRLSNCRLNSIVANPMRPPKNGEIFIICRINWHTYYSLRSEIFALLLLLLLTFKCWNVQLGISWILLYDKFSSCNPSCPRKLVANIELILFRDKSANEIENDKSIQSILVCDVGMWTICSRR